MNKVANFIDEFILRYKVDTKDADKKLDGFVKQLKGIAATAKGDVSGAALSMGKAFLGAAGTVAIAGAAIVVTLAAVYKAIKMCVDGMQDYNEQQNIARRTGLGPLQQEAVAMNMSRGSHGRVNREESRRTQNAIGEYVRSAFTDPTKMNSQNIRLRMMGISPTATNGDIKGTGQIMDELGKRWKTMTEEAARAEGDLLGISAQATDAMRQLGGAVADTSGITLAMAERQDAAAESAKELNEAVNGMEDDFAALGKYISDTLMPYVTAFMKILQDLVHNVIQPIVKDGLVKGIGHIGEAMWDNLKARITGKDPEKTMSQSLEDTQHKNTEEEEKKRQQILKKQSDNANTNLNASAKLELTANRFATAVNAMPGSVDMQAAIAAWAGMAGRGQVAANDSGGSGKTGSGGSAASAAGGGGGGGKATRGIRNNNPGNIEYGKFAISQGATGTDGRFAIFPSMEAGVKAHEALLSGSGYLGKGLDTPAKIIAKYAPASENNQAAYLKAVAQAGFGANQKLTAADMGKFAAAMQVHESGYRGGPASNYVNGNSVAARGGTSQNDLNELTFAGTLGMDAGQLMRGEGRRGDVEYMVKKRRFELANSITALQAQIEGADAKGDTRGAGKLRQQLFGMQSDWMAVDKFGQGMIDRQKDKGGQDRTKLMPTLPTVNVTINGANDPHAIVKILTEEVQKAHNEHSSKFMV